MTLVSPLVFTVRGRAVTWKRPAGSRGGWRHTEPAHATYKAVVTAEALAEVNRKKLPKPAFPREDVRVGIVLYGPGPGDVDNFAKLILDALEGPVYVNDRQVADLHVRRYTDAHPRAVITVEEWPA